MKGVDINYGDVDNTTALTVSIMNKQYSFAKFLLDRGANPNMVDASGRTALYAIVDTRNEDWTTLPERKTDDALPSIEIVKAAAGSQGESEHCSEQASSGKEWHGQRRYHPRRGRNSFDACGKVRRCAGHASSSGCRGRSETRDQRRNKRI